MRSGGLLPEQGSPTSQRLPSSLQNEARDLVKNGITPAEYGKALTILLRRGSEPDKAGMRLDEVRLWFWIAITALVTLTILLSFTATTAFEIGKGKRSVAWQKWHGNLLTEWLPAFIIMGIVASIIGAFIHDRLQGK
jgi:hypothetical protein